jgi:hypothetical protein
MKRVFLAMAALCAAPALLAQETGSLIRNRPAQIDSTSTAGARTTMLQFAQCIVGRDRGRVARMVELPVNDAEYGRLSKKLFDSMDEQCLGDGGLSFNTTLFTGALFDALYVREFRYNGPTAFPASVTTSYVARYTAPYSQEVRQALALEQFGECVARAEPAETRKLLLALPGTATEREQFALLTPRFGACVVKGSTVAMSKSIIRGALAEGMYRLSKVVADGALGAAK